MGNVIDTAGTDVASASAVTPQAELAEGSLGPNGGVLAEGVGEEMMTLSVFRTASSATTDTVGSRRRRQGVAGAGMAVDDDVV